MLKTIARSVNFLFGKFFINKKIFLSSSLDYFKKKRNIDPNYFDYVRLATLELLSYEINEKGMSGNVAELGVYKGKFAKHINKYFPDRTLYLFDTFEGFSQNDSKVDVNMNLSPGSQNFADTSVQNVLAIMPHANNCIIKKGYFPETATGMDDKFVLVSIDADLYSPIYSGLEYFYPRLQPGGYILVHDYNNDNYKGSKKAVREFCAKNNISYMPIPDSGGSAIITK